MFISKNNIPVKIDVPGAKARQELNFGEMSEYKTMGAEYFTFGKGVDMTELLHGLEGNMCQCPHWGYVISGKITAIYPENEETVSKGDLFYWPPGHSVRAEEDTEIIMFSPQKEHCEVIDHVLNKINS